MKKKAYYDRLSEIMWIFFKNRGQIVGNSILIGFEDLRKIKITLTETNQTSSWGGFTVAIIHKYNGLIDKQFFSFNDFLATKRKANKELRTKREPFVLHRYNASFNIEWKGADPSSNKIDAMIKAIDRWIMQWK